VTRQEEGEHIVGLLGRTLAEELEDQTTGPRMGFCLLVFDFDDGNPKNEKFVAYCSNAPRQDMIKVLREHLARTEAGCN